MIVSDFLLLLLRFEIRVVLVNLRVCVPKILFQFRVKKEAQRVAKNVVVGIETWNKESEERNTKKYIKR